MPRMTVEREGMMAAVGRGGSPMMPAGADETHWPRGFVGFVADSALAAVAAFAPSPRRGEGWGEGRVLAPRLLVKNGKSFVRLRHR